MNLDYFQWFRSVSIVAGLQTSDGETNEVMTCQYIAQFIIIIHDPTSQGILLLAKDTPNVHHEMSRYANDLSQIHGISNSSKTVSILPCSHKLSRRIAKFNSPAPSS
jgi:hypothetical protein